MKKLFLLLFISSMVFCQNPEDQNTTKGFHKHDGFYLSLAGGPALGNINLEATNLIFKKPEMSGAGFQFDFKVGLVISEASDLILSLDIISRVLSSPTLTLDGKSTTTSSNVTASDVMYGLGIAKYFMPSNIFLNASVGVGKFSLEFNNTTSNSEAGFAFQLKCGKEWWVSSNWGLGAAAGVALISADDQKDSSLPGYSGKLSTTKFFITFNATFN